MTRTLDLSTLTLQSGSHSSIDQGACVMEVVSYIAGEPFSDHPKCASPVLTSYAIGLNDRFDTDRRQELKPYIPLIVGTRGDGQDEARSYLALDWLIRTYTPAFLDLRPELAEVAAELRGLRPIVDMAAAEAAGPVVRKAQKQSAAAEAAGPVVRKAQKQSAAAWDAAGAAAGDAAWDATRDATRDAAGDAAWDATRAAARAAAGDALRPTVEQLQTSAIALLGQMINPAAVTA